MNINYNNLTFIIVTFKSENIIENCLETLPKDVQIIIIENSGNYNLKEYLEKKYNNLSVFIEKNDGMGHSNNIGIKYCKTDFAFILNPDIRFKDDTFENLINSSKLIKDFAIISPISSNDKYPNYKIKDSLTKNDEIIDVDYIDGFSMLINISKFKDQMFFDKNFFLYLENNDLCLRIKNKSEKIYILKKSLIDHEGASSSDIKFKDEIEYTRNWHWMWSKFYFNKKHKGFLIAFFIIMPNLFSGTLKYFFYLLIFNSYKKKIYFMRISGILNSILGKKSWYRPNIKY